MSIHLIKRERSASGRRKKTSELRVPVASRGEDTGGNLQDTLDATTADAFVLKC